MNNHSQSGLFPWVSLLTGSVSLPLRCWLLSSIDNNGLLPRFHITGILSLLLLLLTAGICFWGLRRAAPSNAYRRRFPPSRLAALGSAISGFGIGISAFTVSTAGILRLLMPILGILCAGALLYAAYCRLIGLRPNCLSHGAMVLFLVFRILSACRGWGAESQLQFYLFPLLGSVFLLLTCYYRAETDAMIGDYRKYLFFGQLALFCCLMCLPGDDWLFYMSAVVWLATDYCVPSAKRY